ncbi:hypothetical protein [Chroococcidiopsis sp. CCNUC1]|uniref:hypothetical protein n=1 Tax=Chroococcidiopsis sp. CCNUC1 TaxID=2653189 RepID=UPI0020224455|nr:hypothetical protein [Chroococcidiopsis sp. CCNUC1]URD48281.1 hypothetical protein M5J74_18270 [Chroococcidiopsis sp. CCNUC1]
MAKPVTDDMRDLKTPDDVIIRAEARKPETDPTLGIGVQVNREGTPRHRLVTIGDSLTQGFQSGAIFNTQISFPALIAREMGWTEFRYPTYNTPGDGLPLNLERLVRELEQKVGDRIDVWNFIPTLLFLRNYLDKLEDYWERGEGTILPSQKEINHNLGVYGWDLRNILSRNASSCLELMSRKIPREDVFRQLVDYHNERAALRVLNSSVRSQTGETLTPLQAATTLGAEGTPENGDADGIETLIMIIGSNNALGSLLTFKIAWSDEGYDDMEINDRYTIWRPIHFKAELDKVVAEVKQIRARHVIWATVPHVTIAPFARGVDTKIRKDSRYFPYYTLPWVSDAGFNQDRHPNLTASEVRAIDSAIDQYNDCIIDAVRKARTEGRDWYLFDLAGLLDRLAQRRYIETPRARPSWWKEIGGEYQLPSQLQKLDPKPDSRFSISDATGRKQGGLFSLDGIHPTTIGYGIMAQELIAIMQTAGVEFYDDRGNLRQGKVEIDFRQLIDRDTLISNPPKAFENYFKAIGWLDRYLSVFGNLLKSNY